MASTSAPVQPSGFLDRLAGNLLVALRHRAFALLWAGQSISRLGDSVYRIALAWWVLDATGSAAAMGTVLVFTFTPTLLFVLLGGVLVDRLPRLRVMFWSDVVRAAVALSMALAAAAGTLELWQVFAASVVFGLAGAFFQPAYAAAVPDVTPEKDLSSANAMTSLTVQFSGIGGPALGALCIALGGSALGFALNGLSFLVASVCVLLAGWRQHSPPGKGERNSIFGDFSEGLRTVFGSTWLWATIAMSALVNVTLAGPISVALPYLLKEERGYGAASFGLILSFAAAGGVVAALILGRRQVLRRRGPIAYAALVGNGLMLIVLSQDLPVWWLWLTALLGGACLEIFGLVWTNTLQQLVPKDRLGRVFSVDQLGSFALLPLAYAGAGWASNEWGAAPVMLTGGVVTTALALFGFLLPSVRRLD